MMMTSQRIKVERMKFAACMTCLLCNKLFREATTISECLHSFCRKCIYKKIADQNLRCCPVCNVDLGCAPRDKIRADHNLQDLRVKLFSCERKKAEESEAFPSVPLPTKRKERCLSSLVVRKPRLQSHSGVIVRRGKSMASKILDEQEVPCMKAPDIVVQDDKRDDFHEIETSSKIAQIRMQNFSNTNSSFQHMRSEVSEDNAEAWKVTADLWKPLNCLMDRMRKREFNFIIQGNAVKAAPEDSHENEAHLATPEVKDDCNNVEVHSDGNGNDSALVPSGSVKPSRSGRSQKRGDAVSDEELNVPAQSMVGKEMHPCHRFPHAT
ncbi:E3 ubiquitin protein ligase DRIP2 [Quillaja saponaria]|uniref:E3 ubiquitin protein ligase DRIP2 n=1 Tax=Quillaja saponaria TaxID=32244 RepID=A0AAD7VL47_QUISA|nr:E3 ubiquitin protein ligase DRIP2 [Quillaja saponaria]